MIKAPYYFILAIPFFLACSSQKTEEVKDDKNTLTDTIQYMAVADTTALALPIAEDDTIKAIKVVYALYGSGVNMFKEMNINSANGITIPFAAPFEVIKEYPEWYKVRVNYENFRGIYFVPIESTSKENPLATILFYPNFEISIKGFASIESSYEGIDQYEAEDYDGPPAFKVHKDTLYLEEIRSSFGYKNQIKITARNPNEKFRVSYAYRQSLYEQIDEQSTSLTSNQRSQYEYTSWSDFTPFYPIEDSSSLYVLPESYKRSGAQKYEAAHKGILKKKYALRDTNLIFKGEGEYGPYETHIEYEHKGKFFVYSIESLVIRIERIVGGEVKEIRYLVLYEESGC